MSLSNLDIKGQQASIIDLKILHKSHSPEFSLFWGQMMPTGYCYSSRILYLLEKVDNYGPIIHLEPCPSVVYEPSVVITGWVESSREILNVWINEESILSRDEAEALIPRFRRIFHKYRSYIYGNRIRFSFTRTIPLKEAGKNAITVYAEDSQKISPLKRIWIEYQVSEIKKLMLGCEKGVGDPI